jgi:hypothetical protein
MLDELLDVMREYFDKEREYLDRVASCETEADMYARQAHALAVEAKDALRRKMDELRLVD